MSKSHTNRCEVSVVREIVFRRLHCDDGDQKNDNNNNDATCISILTMRVAEGIEARRLASVIDKVGGPRTLRFLI